MQANLHVEWGNRLRACRQAAGLSQMAVAAAAHVDKGYYARIERGEVGGRGVGDDLKIRIAAALSKRVEDIWAYPDPATAAKEAS